MTNNGFERRVLVQEVIENQLPEFILSESPKVSEFLKQYYISQEYQGGPADIAENIDQYLKVDNLIPEVVVDTTALTEDVLNVDNKNDITPTINVSSTKGFPEKYGLLKINDEIITYKEKTSTSFLNCVRGFSGITNYHSSLDREELVFTATQSSFHAANTTVYNLSSLFLKEFYKKVKYSYTPGLENIKLHESIDVGNFIKEARTFYQSKGTEESFKILFKALYGENIKVVDLEQYLVKPSSSEFLRREVIVADEISGNLKNLVGQTIQKSSDPNTRASISEIETFTRLGKLYYKILLFVGYDDRTNIEGTFEIQPNSIVSNKVLSTDTVVTVDSTVGFEDSGNIVYHTGDSSFTIPYTSKTVNQFLGCSIPNGLEIPTKSVILNDNFYFGYENGDITKICKFRITGVISSLKENENTLIEKNEKISIKNLGKRIKNPTYDKTRKEVFSNSWIYNTSVRIDVDKIKENESVIILKAPVDRSFLKKGDVIDILDGDTETVKYSNATVSNIDGAQIALDNYSTSFYDDALKYTIRRKYNTANSLGTPIEFGNRKLLSDVQNVYDDGDNMYVASNSLPSYTLTSDVKTVKSSFNSTSSLKEKDSTTENYTVLSFDSEVPFINGDEVVYFPSSTPLTGLISGKSYYVEVVEPNKIKLYSSLALLGQNIEEQFNIPVVGTHTFILSTQKVDTISPQKVLKKFPLNPENKKGTNEKTLPGSTGMLVNGVEISNYKSFDKIYYGPLDTVNLYNGGSGYDVVNSVSVTIDSPVSGGTTALVKPIIQGNLEEILVDEQDFDIIDVSSVSITGGNSKGVNLLPIVTNRYRTVSFNASHLFGGGIQSGDDTIEFLSNHYFIDGDAILYQKGEGSAIGIGEYGGSNNISDLLSDGVIYYANVVSDKKIKIHNTKAEAISGINTVGLTTSLAQGIHKFRTADQRKTLSKIEIINAGTGFENKEIILLPDSVSIYKNTIQFKNHGFSDGEEIVYKTDGTNISGLTHGTKYFVSAIDKDTFSLATTLENVSKREFINFTSTGSGYQKFAYPDIEVSISASYRKPGTSITLTPIVRGKISHIYLYDKGSKYGNTTLNYNNRPLVNFNSGKDASLSPVIINGKIDSVVVNNGGYNYTSSPELEIIGTGSNAKIRAEVSNGKITNVFIINGGFGYDNNTKVKPYTPGSGAYAETSITALNINNYVRYGKNENLLISDKNTGTLKYSVVKYSENLLDDVLTDDKTKHSPIIGWAYDGNPIYGQYAYSDPTTQGSLKDLKSSYIVNNTFVTSINRPEGFDVGFFIEDYIFDKTQGDLDAHNGRFAKTPEFPNGTYAYYQTSNSFPYIIGDSYRGVFEKEYLNQDFDFNNSTLRRNTLPYGGGQPFINNDFIVEPYELFDRKTIVESITSGKIDDIEIIDSGYEYKVNDVLNFDNSNTNGSGLSAHVNYINGKEINDISSSLESSTNVVFEYIDKNYIAGNILPSHNYNDGDSIIVSGLSTSIRNLNGFHTVGVTSSNVSLLTEVSANTTAGIVTDIYLTSSNNLRSDINLGIGTETLSVLNVFENENIVRVIRGISGVAHTASTNVNIKNNKIVFNVDTDYFESSLDDKIYFNPVQSIGIGTTSGNSSSNIYSVGLVTSIVSVPTKSIYLPKHPFKTGQQVTLTKPSGSNSIVAYDGNNDFNIPNDISSFYIVKNSNDYVSISSERGATSSSSCLYFKSFSSNNDGEDYQYALETNKTQVTGNVDRVKAVVTTKTPHELSNLDDIKLNIISNKTLGIGNSTAVSVKYVSEIGKIVFDSKTFNSSNVNTSSNSIEIQDHGLKTGDKVYYDSNSNPIAGLDLLEYYVYRVDDNNIKLGFTRDDVTSFPEKTIDISSTGGNGTLSLINPKIIVINNNNLKFDLSDSSLSGYELGLYYDLQFNNPFVSTGTTNTFTINENGTPGSSGAYLTLNYGKDNPNELFYSLKSNNSPIIRDSEVFDGSKIQYQNSVYNSTHTATGIGTTTFSIYLNNIPEVFEYDENDTQKLEYYTNSSTAKGGVHSVKIDFNGIGYMSLPIFENISSSSGYGANISLKTNDIGKINTVNIVDTGFDYSSDKTLTPELSISPNIEIINDYEVDSIDILSGGFGYTTEPDLLFINSITGEVYNQGFLKCSLDNGASILRTEIVETQKNLPSDGSIKVVATNNTNGIGILDVVSSNSGIVVLTISTPILGYTTQPFSINDEVYIEGIQKLGTSGDGFNSADHKHSFFKITNYVASNPVQITVDLSEHTTNTGTAISNQGGYASLIKKDNYPTFKVTAKKSNFVDDEEVSIVRNGVLYNTNLKIQKFKDKLKVYGSFDLNIGDTIVGLQSKSWAEIYSLKEKSGEYIIGYSLKKNYKWDSDVGKLNSDNQVLSDNDYYQNLSYTIKSKQTFEEISSNVDNLIHISGLKNFADTLIEQSVESGVKNSDDNTTIILDIESSNRVDEINDFAMVKDLNTLQNVKSKYLEFSNKKLTSYNECNTNRVLVVDDDLSKDFSNVEDDIDLFVDIFEFDTNLDKLHNFIIQVSNTNYNERQIVEIATMPSNSGNIVSLEKINVYNTETPYVDIEVVYDEIANLNKLRMRPTDPFNKTYDVKILHDLSPASTIGSSPQNSSLGFSKLVSTNISVLPGESENLFTSSIADFECIFVTAELINSTTGERNYVELYLNENGDISEYRFDNIEPREQTSKNIGTFDVSVPLTTVQLDFNNTESNEILVKANIIIIGNVSEGTGSIYHFKSTGQPDSTAKNVKLQSNTISGTASQITVFMEDITNISAIKTFAKVSHGNDYSLHQFVILNNGSNLYVKEYPILSSDSSGVGIGTFGATFGLSDIDINFYKDSSYTGSVIVQTYSEVFDYRNDIINIPNSLYYGTHKKEVLVSSFAGKNTSLNQQLEFEMNYKNIPIFEKSFDPSNCLDLTTDIFTLKDINGSPIEHFFSTGEKLYYSAGSSFGSASSSMGLTSGLIQSAVYAIKLSNYQFKLASSKLNAQNGNALDFNSHGTGNYHKLEMDKKNEKTIITVDGIIQSPVNNTKIQHALYSNGGTIGATDIFLSLNSIESIVPGDILKINDEYMKVDDVGIGPTTDGPINSTGGFNLVQVTRGIFGTDKQQHFDGDAVKVYVGSYNIVGNKLYFIDAPRGSKSDNEVDESNRPLPKSSFSGRVFLRNDYTTNKIYDSVSKEFTGIGATFTLTVDNAPQTGIETGSGLVLLNNVYQTPTTVNNPNNNYLLEESNGETKIIFSGIQDENNDYILSDYDVNANQLPRGGMIVSLGSTPGLGYAPLVGASITSFTLDGNDGIDSVLGLVGSGYTSTTGTISIGVTETGHTGTPAVITANIGIGGTLTFSVDTAGSDYTNPTFIIPEPSYDNLEVVGISRRGIGLTTETGTGLLVNVVVEPTSRTGTASTLFEVSSFKIVRPGWNFKPGDVFTPVGLVTTNHPDFEPFEMRVLETFTDNFTAWQFGELDYIDSVKSLQDGERTRFPLYYNSNLLSFEINEEDNPDSIVVDLNALLVIFVNGVIQEPNKHYVFNGGTSFTFKEAPSKEDNVSIYFYRGERDVDSKLVEVNQIIENGDSVRVLRNNSVPNTKNQGDRRVLDISTSEQVETDLYTGDGIDEENDRPLTLIRQKTDTNVRGEFESKVRDSLETQVYPSAKILKTTSNQIYVDNAQSFYYEENLQDTLNDLSALISLESTVEDASFTVEVNSSGQINNISIVDGGSGYTGSTVNLSIESPNDVIRQYTNYNQTSISVGINTRATATATVTNGSLTNTTITNPGSGYTSSNLPQVIAPAHQVQSEFIKNINNVAGFSGIITGITAIQDTDLYLEFYMEASNVNGTGPADFTTLEVGTPIYVYDTYIGAGATSVDNSDNIIGIGTTFLDNVYYVSEEVYSVSKNSLIDVGVVTCKMSSTSTNIIGLSTSTEFAGKFSWGRLQGTDIRSDSPLAIDVNGYTVSGLATYPSIQRRGVGLRNTGSYKKVID